MCIRSRNFGVLLGHLPIGQFQLSVFFSDKPEKKNGVICSMIEATSDPMKFWGSVPPSRLQSSKVRWGWGFLGLGTSRKQDLHSLCFRINHSCFTLQAKGGEA